MTIAPPHPDIVDPGFRRHLADIVSEAVHLADAVERSVACVWIDPWTGQLGDCTRPAEWLVTGPTCECLHFLCGPHWLVEVASLNAWTGTVPEVQCGLCGALAAPETITWSRL